MGRKRAQRIHRKIMHLARRMEAIRRKRRSELGACAEYLELEKEKARLEAEFGPAVLGEGGGAK